MKRRIGKFYLNSEFIDNIDSPAKDVLFSMGFVPTRVEYLWHTGLFEYIGYSHIFPEVETGAIIPEYQIQIEKGQDGVVKASIFNNEGSVLDHINLTTNEFGGWVKNIVDKGD